VFVDSWVKHLEPRSGQALQFTAAGDKGPTGDKGPLRSRPIGSRGEVGTKTGRDKGHEVTMAAAGACHQHSHQYLTKNVDATCSAERWLDGGASGGVTMTT
jgi:hypothetical protein